MRIVLLGPPGSGKETQAVRIAEHYGIKRVLANELLHGDGSAPADADPMPHYSAQRLARPDVAGGFVISGFPRMLQQAMTLDDVLGDKPLQMVIRIDIDADVMIERLAGRRRCRSCHTEYNIFISPPKLDDQCDECGGALHQRVDDTERVIDNRLRVYEGVALPVSGFYRAAGILHDVDGSGSIEAVTAEICALLDPLAETQSGKRARKAS